MTSDPHERADGVVDYIIVGAGSAGCVLAERLTADGRGTVLLLEAGSTNRSPYIEMPRGWVKLWRDPRYTWRFPIENEAGRAEGEAWVYGKGIGGSSAINGTTYARGHQRDYEEWAKVAGSDLWGWPQMSRCFREMETFEGGATRLRGDAGPVAVTFRQGKPPLLERIIAAGVEMGLPRVADVNDPAGLGIGYTQMTIDRRGRRVSADSAFLRPARRRPNLTVETGVLVDKVIVRNGRAVGVACRRNGAALRFDARRDVILSAGVLQSPKLLQLSGIGPAALLRAHGIDVVRDAPAVGENLIDHVMLSIAYRLHGAAGINREFRGPRLWANVLRYWIDGGGVMSYATSEVMAYASTPGLESWPDLQLFVSPYSMPASVREEPGRGKPDSLPGITITGNYLRPQSRGTVSIRSSRPDDPPRVHANRLANTADGDAILEMTHMMQRLMRQPALRPFVGEETSPGLSLADAETWPATIRVSLSAGLHATGTCAMGSDERGVVDARLRVRGVTNLRVVDCSIIPVPISGNTNAPAMATALRAAELILADRS